MSIQFKITDKAQINKALNWADENTLKALAAGPVIMTLRRETRNNEQNAKMWVVLQDFEPIEFNGRKWKKEDWKCFILSAFNNEMPAVGLLGEPVSVSLRSSTLTKKRFSELLEFMYSVGCERGVKFSEQAANIYEEYR